MCFMVMMMSLWPTWEVPASASRAASHPATLIDRHRPTVSLIALQRVRGQVTHLQLGEVPLEIVKGHPEVNMKVELKSTAKQEGAHQTSENRSVGCMRSDDTALLFLAPNHWCSRIERENVRLLWESKVFILGMVALSGHPRLSLSGRTQTS